MTVIRDGDWRLYSSDIKRGRYTWIKHEADGSVVMRTDHHVDAIVDQNKAFRNMLDPGFKGDWHRIASLPASIAYGDLGRAFTEGDEKYVKRWLNDGDNAAWRTKEGRV